jgi:hypothetical protein
MKKLVCQMAVALMLLGTAVAEADSRDRHFRDSPAWSHRADRAYDRGRPGRYYNRYHNDSRRWDRNRYGDYGRDHHRHWRHRRYEHWYPRGYSYGDDYRYWRGAGRYDSGSYGDLRIVLNVPLW